MSNDKNVKGSKEQGAVVDINNDQQDYDKNHNSGGGGIVVMRGGKPELAGQQKSQRGIPTKEELEAKQKEEDNSMAVRVTMLPDELDPFSEEKEISVERSRKKSTKQITRIDVDSEQTEPVEPLKPVEAKKKRGRPRKS